MSNNHHSKPPSWKPHRDWRVIVAAIIMLIAMLAYVLTMNESLVPDNDQAPTPIETP